MLITEAIQKFSDYLKFEKRYSAHTLTAYLGDLEHFAAFASRQFDCTKVEEVITSFVRTWLADIKEETDAEPKTINRKISSLKSFFKFLLRRQMVAVTPMATISAQKQRKRLPQFIDKKDTENLWHHTEFPATWNGRTERLVLMLFYQTGMRLSELVNLKEKQIDFSNTSLKILGKGNKERIIPCNAVLIADIKAYADDKRKEFEQFDDTFLLVNDKGRPLYSKWVYKSVRKYLDAATTIEKRSPHVMRHTFATHLLNEGAELNAVKDLLGHSSLASTQVYTHNTIGKLKEVFKKAHPKA